MKKFGKFLLAGLLLLACCNYAFALSDNEYAQLMKNAAFARADKALSKAWKEAQNKLAKNKTALNNLRKDQREWVRTGRDSDAEDFMDVEGYSKLKAYTVATEERAAYLPHLAQQYLEEAGGTSNKKSQAESKPQAKKQEQVKTQAKAPSKSKAKANNYPALALCTGNSVRLRDNPGTDSEILARADRGDVLILLKSQNVNGDLWYAADNPVDQGTVWISGQFVDVYSENNNDNLVYKTAISVRTDYGLKPEKARALHGEPNNVASDKFFSDPAGKEMQEDTLEYENLILRYVDNRLRHVEVFGTGLAFGSLLVGQSGDDIITALGEPSSKADDNLSFTYKVSSNSNEEFLFELDEDGVITRMTWDDYIDG
ncbi:MAG: SH3 domain-containing protein [Synergistaceae bacterium]|nr:SH3 domain-containing protein [Synergistaceae bacterium]MBR1602241.1 SH3 domain-containing protein [Synergistaceae bacterium]